MGCEFGSLRHTREHGPKDLGLETMGVLNVSCLS